LQAEFVILGTTGPREIEAAPRLSKAVFSPLLTPPKGRRHRDWGPWPSVAKKNQSFQARAGQGGRRAKFAPEGRRAAFMVYA